MRAFLIAIEVVAAAITGALLVHETVTTSLLGRFAVLLGLCIGYAEVGARSQRITRYLSSGKVFTNPMSVWSFAALLVLPAGWASLFIAGQYAHSMLQRRRERSGNTHRVVFTAAVTMTAQLITAAVLAAAGGSSGHALQGSVVGGLVVALCVPVFVLVNLTLLVAGIRLAARPPSLRLLIPGADTLTTEATTLLLGIVAAELLMHSPVLLPITLVFIATLQRSSTVKALHQTARTDAKTGLLTSAAWTASVQNVLARLAHSGGGIAVLLIDLDHFKRINDEYGHLVGDRVLAAVGTCLQRELRERDAVCRFGGEEFAAVLAGPDAEKAATVAERVCAALRDVRVEEVSFTASVGLAHDRAGRPGVTVEALLARADGALYAAKRQGRNQVRVGALVAH